PTTPTAIRSHCPRYARRARARPASHGSPCSQPPSSSLPLQQPAVRADAHALLVEPLADEELERRPGAPARVEHAIDLPFGEQRVVLLARLGPVRELRQAAERPRQRDALLDRALETLLPHRH